MKKQLQAENHKQRVNRITPVLFAFVFILAQLTGLAQTAYISNLGDNTVTIINVATNTVTDTIKVGSNPYGVSVSLDGNKVYVANRGDSTVSVINTATNTVSATIEIGAGAYDLSVSPDGSRVYVSNAAANKVSVINTATNTVSTAIPVGNTPEGIAVSPDGSKVYVANANLHTVSVISTATNTVSGTITFSSFPYGVCVSPDGSKVYVTVDGTNKVCVVNAATNIVSDSIPVGTLPWAISISPDGSKVYAANLNSNSVSVINTATNTVSATVAVSGPEGISVSPDGSKVYVTDANDNTVNVINAATNAVSAIIHVGILPIAFGNFISSPAVLPAANFQASDSTICANSCIGFTNLSTHSTSWQWRFAGAADSTSAAQNPANVCYPASGTYNVTLIASGGGKSDTVIFSNYIHVIAPPPAPVITQQHDTLYCSTDSSYSTYQWYNDTTLVPGATDTFFVVMQNGNYNMKVTNAEGCSIAVGINITTGINSFLTNECISLFPNPVTDELKVSGDWKSQTGKLTISNVLGEIIYTQTINNKAETINCKPFPAGIYLVQVYNGNSRWAGKFVKE